MTELRFLQAQLARKTAKWDLQGQKNSHGEVMVLRKLASTRSARCIKDVPLHFACGDACAESDCQMFNPQPILEQKLDWQGAILGTAFQEVKLY